jgi:hypothetical protein
MQNCVDVPKEVCVRVRKNPRKIKRPIIKKWCYVPTEESGLDSDDQDETTLAPVEGDDSVEGDSTAPPSRRA